MADNRFFRIPTNFLTGGVGYDNYIKGYGRYKVPQYEPSQYAGIGRDLGKNYIDIDIVPEGNAPKFEGGISRNVGNAEEIERGLNTLYGNGNQAKSITKEVGTKVKKSIPFVPIAGDLWDIGAGYNRLAHPVNNLDPWLGVGQMGLGIAGLATLPFGGGFIKTGLRGLARGIGKNKLSRGLGLSSTYKLADDELIKTGLAELKRNRTINKNLKKISDYLHKNWRGWEAGGLGLYDLFKNPYNYEEPDIESTTDEGDASSQVDIPSDTIEYDNAVPPNLVEIIEAQKNSNSKNQQGPISNSEQFIRDLVATKGINTDEPQYNQNGEPVNKSAFREFMSRDGMSWTPEQINNMLNGLNGGDPNAKRNIDLYNASALPGQEIKIPRTQEEIDDARALAGKVDNQDNVEDEYLDELMNYYSTQRNNYNDYVNAINDLADNYGDRYRLDYNLRQGDLLPQGQPSVSEALAKRADMYKLSGDVNNKYDKMMVEALANYRMGRALGLPLGSDFASQDMVKNYIDIKKADKTAYDKLALELIKLASQSEEKAKDRESRLNIATMQVQAANDRANLTNDLKKQELALKQAEIQGKWDLAAELRNSINNTNIMLNATKIVGEAGIYGVEDPEALNTALEILGYKDKVKPITGNTMNSIEEKYKKYGGK